jgi:DNA-binding protein HU-beta
MNKSEFIAFMTEGSDKTRTEAEGALNFVIDSVLRAIANKKSVNLVGFGSWTIAKRKERDGHNPKTGAKMKIPAYNQPVFKAGQKLKDACNS